jgi:hypothetical protein
VIALRRCLGFACAILFAACGGSNAVRPETKLAATITEFQKSANDFTDARREIVHARQALLNDTETDTGRTRFDVNQTLGIWRVADEKDKLELYDRLLASTRAAGDAGEALRTLGESHRQALAETSTKVQLNQEQLAAAIRTLTSLGTAKSWKEQLKFYYEFLDETKTQVDELKGKVDDAKKTAAQGSH